MKFKDAPIHDIIVTPLKKFHDKRGWLTETFRWDTVPEQYQPQMAYTSLSHPGVARGPHEHVDQSDLFVFLGPGTFRIWLWDNREDSPTYLHRMVFEGGEDEALSVLIPPGVVHAYKNLSPTMAAVQNFPNRMFMGPGKKDPIDEVRHEDDPNTPYQLN